MNKFKLGDKVRVTNYFNRYRNDVTTVAQVVTLGGHSCYRLSDIPFIFFEEDIEKVNK